MKPIIQGALDALGARIRALEVLPAKVIAIASALMSLTTLVGSGRLWVNRQVLTGSGTYVPTPGTRRILVRMVGGGGAGGGANNTTAPTTAGAGGNSGWYLEFRITGSAGGLIPKCDFNCGGGGIGSGGAGATGADTIFDVNGTTFTAKGGTGGDSIANLNAEPLPPALGSTSSGVDFSYYGPGGAGIPVGGQISYSGFGGSVPPFGSGGFAIFFGATASPGLGFGSGGSGGASNSGIVLGGSGAPGAVAVDEFV